MNEAWSCHRGPHISQQTQLLAKTDLQGAIFVERAESQSAIECILAGTSSSNVR